MGRDLTVCVDGGWGRQAGERSAGKKGEKAGQDLMAFSTVWTSSEGNKEPLNGFKRE